MAIEDFTRWVQLLGGIRDDLKLALDCADNLLRLPSAAVEIYGALWRVDHVIAAAKDKASEEFAPYREP